MSLSEPEPFPGYHSVLFAIAYLAERTGTTEDNTKRFAELNEHFKRLFPDSSSRLLDDLDEALALRPAAEPAEPGR